MRREKMSYIQGKKTDNSQSLKNPKEMWLESKVK